MGEDVASEDRCMGLQALILGEEYGDWMGEEVARRESEVELSYGERMEILVGGEMRCLLSEPRRLVLKHGWGNTARMETLKT